MYLVETELTIQQFEGIQNMIDAIDRTQNALLLEADCIKKVHPRGTPTQVPTKVHWRDICVCHF